MELFDVGYIAHVTVSNTVYIYAVPSPSNMIHSDTQLLWKPGIFNILQATWFSSH
jgi:hypothetical protein